MASFLLNVRKGRSAVALLSTHSIEWAEKLTEILTEAGLTVTVTHAPEPAEVKMPDKRKGPHGAN